MSKETELAKLRRAILEGATQHYTNGFTIEERKLCLAAEEIWAAGWRPWPFAAGLAANAVIKAADWQTGPK